MSKQEAEQFVGNTLTLLVDGATESVKLLEIVGETRWCARLETCRGIEMHDPRNLRAA